MNADEKLESCYRPPDRRACCLPIVVEEGRPWTKSGNTGLNGYFTLNAFVTSHVRNNNDYILLDY